MRRRSGWYGAVPLSHALLTQWVREGDRVVDATCGNGHDTLLLARIVGKGGHVHAFDIQGAAIHTTRERLREEGLLDRVTLIQGGHESMGRSVSPGVRGILFNLGFLPGGERGVTTLPDTTSAAITEGMGLLAPGGVIVVACYTGHDDGREGREIVSLLSRLDPVEWNVWEMHQVNRSRRAPFLLLMEKRPTEET